jgi:AP2 domain
MVREIELTNGGITLVSDEDFDYLSQWSWYKAKGYIVRNRRIDEAVGSARILMHREILGRYMDIDGFEVDHRDMCRFNNVRENLRVATRSQNRCNTKPFSNNRLGIKGVYFNASTGKYRAMININGKARHLGYYATKEEAMAVYDSTARMLHEDFARPNSDEVVTVSSSLRAPPKSAYRGVFPVDKTSKTWMARIRVKGELLYLGAYDTQEEAARRYDSAAVYYYGEKARLNFPDICPSPVPAQPSHLLRGNSSGFRGVSRHGTRWQAAISVNGNSLFLGSFASPVEGARAYDAAALRLHGTKAKLNFPL